MHNFPENIRLNIKESLDLADIFLLHLDQQVKSGSHSLTQHLGFVLAHSKQTLKELRSLENPPQTLALLEACNQVVLTLLESEQLTTAELIFLLSKSFDQLRSELDEGSVDSFILEDLHASLKNWLETHNSSLLDRDFASLIEALPAPEIRVLHISDSHGLEKKKTGEILGQLGLYVEKVDSVAQGLFQLLSGRKSYDLILLSSISDTRESDFFLKTIEELSASQLPQLRRKVLLVEDVQDYARLKHLLNFWCVYAVHQSSLSAEALQRSTLAALSYKGKFLHPKTSEQSLFDAH